MNCSKCKTKVKFTIQNTCQECLLQAKQPQLLGGKMKGYGKELILDLHKCDPDTFNRVSIENYFTKLCRIIGMQAEKIVWWDDMYTPVNKRETEPHLKGTSAVQFIKTSNITIHTLDLMKNVYINIFSCKDFNVNIAKNFSKKFFKGKIVNYQIIERK